MGSRIVEPHRELLERPGQLACRVFDSVDLWRGRNQIPNTRPPKPALKEAVRVVNVAYDLLETGEIFTKGGIKSGARMEKTSERSVIDRTRRIGVEPAFGNGRDVTVAEDL